LLLRRWSSAHVGGDHLQAGIGVAQKRKRAMLGRIGPAAVETTGTIPKSPSAPAKQNALRRSCRIGSVRGSRALVENRRGDIFEITEGSMLPGHRPPPKRSDAR
jgi:hypothetical protein